MRPHFRYTLVSAVCTRSSPRWWSPVSSRAACSSVAPFASTKARNPASSRNCPPEKSARFLVDEAARRSGSTLGDDPAPHPQVRDGVSLVGEDLAVPLQAVPAVELHGRLAHVAPQQPAAPLADLVD